MIFESFAIAFCRKETMTTIGYGVSDPLRGRSGDSARKVLTEWNEQFQCKIDKDCGRICSMSVDGKGETGTFASCIVLNSSGCLMTVRE